MNIDRSELRVLIADDTKANRMLLERILRRLGVQVREAADGAEVVAEARQWQPHLILMDVNMPLVSGVDALQRIRSQPMESAPRVIAVTADALVQGDEFYRGQGFDEVVRKPFSQSQILAAISRQLGISIAGAKTAAPGANSDSASAAQLPAPIPIAPTVQLQIHDLKNALTVIKGHAELLAEERAELGEAIVDGSIQEIVRQVKRLEAGLSTLEGYLRDSPDQ